MNILGKVGDFFKTLGGLIGRGLKCAVSNGLTDEIVGVALVWVRVAAVKYVDDSERRESVVKILKDKGVPEGIARMAVELAYCIFKHEIQKLPTEASDVTASAVTVSEDKP